MLTVLNCFLYLHQPTMSAFVCSFVWTDIVTITISLERLEQS